VSRAPGAPVEIRICSGSGCLALGALDVLEATREAAARSGLAVAVAARPAFVGCRGFCSQGPLVAFPAPDVLYCRVSPADVAEILERTVGRGEIVERLLYLDPVSGRRCRGVADNPFFAPQKRRVLARCGAVDPEDIEHAMAHGAYRALDRALGELDPAAVIELVKRSGLQERAGAGFPVGLKWAVVAEAAADEKVVIGNGDSGDPGLTVDRTLLEGDPHGVIEGLVIAGFAVGARTGRLFLRSEHRVAVARTERAVVEARRRGIVGRAVLGRDFSFEIEIHTNGGSSVGGEETVLLSALHGRRPVARPRPPYPAVSGLWGRPTLINCLETLANIPLIVGDGGARHDERPGLTRVVGLSGAVRRPGLAEVGLGVTVGELVTGIGGGAIDDEISAVHVGGPGGTTLGPQQLGAPLDSRAPSGQGANLGSASVVVLGRGDCPVAVARYLVATCAEQSCGACPPCRIGTKVVLNLLDRVESGAAEPLDLDRLERLGRHIGRTALCEIGRNASRTLLASLGNLRQRYEAHLGGVGCLSGRPQPSAAEPRQ
jgi:NADH-quinone oxidoreductase subunit F